MMNRLKKWARQLKRQLFMLYFACRDPRVPWYAKLFTACVVAYAFSPIDLIPDFIPVLGYIDDILLVPLGIFFALKMIPKPVAADCEERAQKLMKDGKPKNWTAGVFVLLIWAAVLTWVGLWIWRR
ncbi:YkvA family protein [Domibacillus sp. DTU_2020_1001157_1_SI_ALB_TIR_016]|uniref:YkvA family protein n=1 Tax=Domibacillus sp. DTU_2020_1001157_1_SI_ALB_TIR_016 TaxID=3077789 RepID=UPI0028E76EDC|nr:YkvA family protein [Domibacillus sp. DTU_2020_1001157_1_SI_ALB_TIR_016]WNS81519.1 YkvA family protein [Domibacillus sp. DTU_2020_1001157_1_SI_ALB_TIR_016]